MCQFTYYKEEEKGNYFPQLYCHITNGFCLYRKKCLTEGKYILIDGNSWESCYIMNDYLKKQDLPSDAYRVASYNVRKSGKVILYVQLEDSNIIKVDSPNNEILDYVYLTKRNGEYVALKDKPNTNKKKKNSKNNG